MSAGDVVLGRFPRLYAAASLKLSFHHKTDALWKRFPRLYAAASLKRAVRQRADAGAGRGFPRLYAAASLKPSFGENKLYKIEAFSAALCRGLIEADRGTRPRSPSPRWFSAALCRGLIEALSVTVALVCPGVAVFRGFMPRPH